MVLLKQIAKIVRIREFLQNIRTQLNARKAKRGNVFNCLPVIATPSDRSISKFQIRRRRRNGSIEIGQIHRRIQRLKGGEGRLGKRRQSRGRDGAVQKITTGKRGHSLRAPSSEFEQSIT